MNDSTSRSFPAHVKTGFAPEGGYVNMVRGGLLSFFEGIRCKDGGWGRWKYHAAMTRPWALNASGTVISLLNKLGALGAVSAEKRQEAIDFFLGCQDPVDGLFKDPLENDAVRASDHHTWPQIWGQRHGAALGALATLGAKPRVPRPAAQFADLTKIDTREWTLTRDWSNPWLVGEDWSRSIQAFVAANPGADDGRPELAPMFEAMEKEVLDPRTGLPILRGCANDLPVAMAGLFKLMMGFKAVGRPVPYAREAIDSTLALQLRSGEFASPRNMCMNWDALWILRELDRQLAGGHRRTEIFRAADRLCEVLLAVYLKPDGGFAFHGEHCTTGHHSIRLCDRPEPIGDTQGTAMCVECLSYCDEWNCERRGQSLANAS